MTAAVSLDVGRSVSTPFSAVLRCETDRCVDSSAVVEGLRRAGVRSLARPADGSSILIVGRPKRALRLRSTPIVRWHDVLDLALDPFGPLRTSPLAVRLDPETSYDLRIVARERHHPDASSVATSLERMMLAADQPILLGRGLQPGTSVYLVRASYRGGRSFASASDALYVESASVVLPRYGGLP